MASDGFTAPVVLSTLRLVICARVVPARPALRCAREPSLCACSPASPSAKQAPGVESRGEMMLRLGAVGSAMLAHRLDLCVYRPSSVVSLRRCVGPVQSHLLCPACLALSFFPLPHERSVACCLGAVALSASPPRCCVAIGAGITAQGKGSISEDGASANKQK